MTTWPTSKISTDDLDQGTDSPARARPAIKAAVDTVNRMIDAAGDPGGVAILDGNAKLPDSDIRPASISRLGIARFASRDETRAGQNGYLIVSPATLRDYVARAVAALGRQPATPTVQAPTVDPTVTIARNTRAQTATVSWTAVARATGYRYRYRSRKCSRTGTTDPKQGYTTSEVSCGVWGSWAAWASTSSRSVSLSDVAAGTVLQVEVRGRNGTGDGPTGRAAITHSL